jgi:hypothetical protein
MPRKNKPDKCSNASDGLTYHSNLSNNGYNAKRSRLFITFFEQYV